MPLCPSPELTPVTMANQVGRRELGVGEVDSCGEATVPRFSGRAAVRAVSKHSLLSGGIPMQVGRRDPRGGGQAAPGVP